MAGELLPALSSADTTPGEPARAPPRREGTAELARRGYDEATAATPPPPTESDVRRLRLTRPVRSADELEDRLVGVLNVMGLDLQPTEAAAWASSAVPSTTTRGSEASISEPLPGIVVTYDADFDDLSVVVNTSLLRERARVDTDAVPWPVARRVADALADQGIIDRSLSIDGSDVAFVRSGVKGPDGSHEQWVDEVLFEANARVDGIALLDAGLRIGVTPAGEVSSLRVTGIDVERLDPVTIHASSEGLRDAFAEYLAQSPANVDSVTVAGRRPVYLLDPDAASATVEPQYLVEYSITVGEGEARMGSRAMMVLLRMTSPSPHVELHLPQRSESPPRAAP